MTTTETVNLPRSMSALWLTRQARIDEINRQLDALQDELFSLSGGAEIDD